MLIHSGYAQFNQRRKATRFVGSYAYLHHPEDLYTTVVHGINLGKTHKEIQHNDDLSEYKNFADYGNGLTDNTKDLYPRLLNEPGFDWRP